ncbi:squalene/phytoene synthase family protein [Streptomyces thinghirensis]|nr:squalene/phytoene synthase family protein [Streptomyces thinghirensis]
MLDAFEDDLRRVFDGTPPTPAAAASSRPCAAARRPPVPFLGLIAANRQDQLVGRYETYDDLLAYCELSRQPGRPARPRRHRHLDARADHAARRDLCTALQVVEHLQDVSRGPGRRDRVYLPAEDMKRFPSGRRRTSPHPPPAFGGRVGTRPGRVRGRARPRSAE